MDKKLLLFLLLTGVVVGIIGYTAGLTDWIQTYSGETGKYEGIKRVVQIGALLVYTYFGVRFFNRRIVGQG